jgi:hypothetical protein
MRHSIRRPLLIVIATLLLAGIAVGGAAVHAAGSPNTWSTGTSLSTVRQFLNAVASPTDTSIYAMDGKSGGGSLATTDAYSPSTNTWSTTPVDDPQPRYGSATAVNGSRIYDLGGFTNPNLLSTANYYTPSTNTWTSISALPTARAYLGAATGSDGRIYAVGGSNNNSTSFFSTVEAWDPITGKWYCSSSGTGCTATATPPAALPTARSNFGIVASGSLIYVIGGQTGSSSFTNVVEAYSPSTNTWICSTGDTAAGCSATTLAPLPTARTARAASANGIIFVIGGYNGSSYLAYVEAYNPTTNSWLCSAGDPSSGCTGTSLVAMPTARAYLGLATGSDGNIYAIGGFNGSQLSTNQAYAPPTVPGSPTSVTATAGDASATVSWTAPGSTGGIPVTSYTVSCSPSCTPVTTSGTSAAVSGLTNGTSYTFTVTAANFVGSGSASAASNAVTPVSACPPNTSNLNVTGATPGNFSASLGGSDQQVYSSLSSYTASNTTCSGWNLQFQASRFQSAGGDTLPAGSLLMAAPTVSTCQSACGNGSTSTAPSVCIHNPSVALDGGTAVTVASAAASTGDGSYTFTPGTIGGGNLALTVPSYAYATTYSATLTVTIAQGPAASC